MLGLVFLLLFISQAYLKPSPSNVLLIYASNLANDEDQNGVPDSLQIVESYSAKYAISSNNLLGVTVPSGGITGWTDFYFGIVDPLKTKLSQLGAQNIEVLLLVYPIPMYCGSSFTMDSLLAIPSLLTQSQPSIYTTGILNPFADPNPGFPEDQTGFNSTVDAWISASWRDVYLVGRLDGPDSVWGIMSRVDQAIYANKYVSLGSNYQNGVIYVDNMGFSNNLDSSSYVMNSSPVQIGDYVSNSDVDLNIAATAFYPLGTGLTVKQQCNGDQIGTGVWCDGSPAVSAPKALISVNFGTNYNSSVFDWNPGSFATDFSHMDTRYSQTYETGTSWVRSALADGVTAVAGVYGDTSTFDQRPRPNVVAYYLLHGYTFAEACFYAMHDIGTKAYCIGDPLLAPFASKTPVIDNTTPSLSLAPSLSFTNISGWVLDISFTTSLSAPELVKVTVRYGLTTAMTYTFTDGVWSSWHHLKFPYLPPSSTIYYQFNVSDPAGNTFVDTVRTFQSSQRLPYNGVPLEIPGVINFYEFDYGGEGIAFHDADTSVYSTMAPRSKDSSVDVLYYGAYSVMNTNAGEWLIWTVNVTKSGIYELTVVMDYSNEFSGRVQFYMDDISISDVESVSPGNTTFNVTALVGIRSLMWKCVSPVSNPGDGCGYYSYLQWEFMEPVPDPSPTPSSTPSTKPSPAESASTKKKDNTIYIIIGAAGGGGVLILIIIIFVVCVLSKQANTQKKPEPEEIPLGPYLPIGTPTPRGTELQKPPKQRRSVHLPDVPGLEIAYHELKFKAELGKGAFGIVYQGEWRNGLVAIKFAHDSDSLTDDQVNEMLKEAILMKKIRPHSNVVQFLGVCTSPLAIVTEFMENGSLANYLMNEKPMTPTRTLEVLKGIASGMYHLISEGIVHRDLAARNVLLSGSLVPKIADFGMSRVVSNEAANTTYTAVGPLKWMAPESILDKQYSEKSDVWSFGIVCIEVLTRNLPYPDMDGTQVCTRVAMGTLKPQVPENCNANLSEIILQCFAYDPQNRIDFKTICELLKQVKM